MKACTAIRQAVRENDVEANIIKNLQDQVKMLKEQRRILRSSNEKFRQKAAKWLEECLPDMEYITNASALRQNKKQFISSFCKALNIEFET